MPKYRFVGEFATVLTGLSHGVNAVLHRKDGHGQPDESTVVASPGDLVETDEVYPHALLVNDATGESDTDPAAAPRPEPVAVPEGVPLPIPLTPEGDQSIDPPAPPAATPKRTRRSGAAKTPEVSQ